LFFRPLFCEQISTHYNRIQLATPVESDSVLVSSKFNTLPPTAEKTAKKRPQTQLQHQTICLGDSDDEQSASVSLEDPLSATVIGSSSVAAPPPPKISHNGQLLANYSLLNQHSKLSVSSRLPPDLEKKYNEMMNCHTPSILQDIMQRSKSNQSALQLEEERFKLKKRARLEQQRAEKEANQKFTENLHAFVNKLSQIRLDEEFETEEDEFPGS
jgi:hypothetical protein